MDQQAIDTIRSKSAELAQMVAKDLGECSAVILIMGEDHAPIGIVDPPSVKLLREQPAARKVFAETLQQMPEAHSYVFLSECWAATGTLEDLENGGPRIPPSQREDRRELLVIGIVCQDGTKSYCTYEIKREPDVEGYTLGEPEQMESGTIESWTDQFFDPIAPKTLH